MITERETKIFDYDSNQDLEDADFLFSDLTTDGVNLCFNNSRIESIIGSLSTDFDPKAEAVVTSGFRNILLAEETEWSIEAIQPLPGMLRIRLYHYAADIVDDYEDDDTEGMPAKRREEAKLVQELFHGCEADITLSYKTAENRHVDLRDISFVLSFETGGTGSFRLSSESTTTIDFSRWLVDAASQSSVEYILTWKNQEHTSFQARKTHAFYL